MSILEHGFFKNEDDKEKLDSLIHNTTLSRENNVRETDSVDAMKKHV